MKMENNKVYFRKYLENIRGVSERTIHHYYDALNHISRDLKKTGLVSDNIYEIQSVEELYKIRDCLKSDIGFLKLDSDGHRMYSSAMNNYIRFAEGFDFIGHKDSFCDLDVEIDIISDTRLYQCSTRQRLTIIKNQIIEAAEHKCSLDPGHETFITESQNKPYMEGHHIIPMQHQEEFKVSLDVYANVICLCPTCHRMLHYARTEDKRASLNRIYHERADRLAMSGIRLSNDEFIELVK